jgi:hypothetical protein
MDKGMSAGDERFRNMRIYLTKMRRDFSDFQRVTIWEYTKAVMPLIYRDEWDNNPLAIMKKHGVDTLPRGVCVVAPRRFGKTVSTAAFVLALALSCPGIAIAVFSTGDRASKALKKEVLILLDRMGDMATSRICRSTDEEVCFAQYPLPLGLGANSEYARKLYAAAETSRMFFFPSSEVGLRGFTANVAVVEEAAYIDPRLFSNVLAPCFTVDKFTMLALSTPDDEFNWYSLLLHNPFFRVVDFGMSCKACKRLGKSESCPHTLVTLPAWKPKAAQRMMKQLLAHDKTAYEREVLGIVVSTTTPMFKEELVTRFRRRRRFKFCIDKPPHYVYVTVDPSGGGFQSDFAVVSMAHELGDYAVRLYSCAARIIISSATAPMHLLLSFSQPHARAAMHLYSRHTRRLNMTGVRPGWTAWAHARASS